MIEIELPDGTIAEFPEGTSQEAIKGALQKRFGGGQQPSQDERNPDGTYGQPPAGMVTDPRTGQMTERALMANNMPDPSNAESALVGGAQGATFGGADEALGGIYAAMPGQGSMPERYAFGREYARAMQDKSQEVNPYVTGGSEMAGGAASALTYGMPAMAGRGLGGAMIAGAGVGGAEGAAYGFLSGEGGPAERGKNALRYGTAGTAMGAAAPLAVSGAMAGGRAVGDFIGGGVDAVTGRASKGRADRAIAKTLMRSGKSTDDVSRALQQAAQEGQPEFRAMDALGIAGQRRASAITRSGGDSSAVMRDFLDDRQLNQPDRVAQFVGDAFDSNTATAKATRDTLERGRDAAADLDFGSIRAAGEPVDVRPAVEQIDALVQPFKEANISSPATKALTRLRKQLAGKSGDADFELSDFNKVFQIRKQLRDEISALYKQGKSGLASDLKKVRQSLDDSMQAASPEYRQAMDRFRDSSRVMDAVEAGQRMPLPGNRAADNVAEFQRMSPDQQAAARVGYGDKALAKVEASAGGANRARPLTSAKAQQEAGAIASDPDLYQRRVGREMDMFETRNIAAGGSRTADNQADLAELQGADVGILTSLLRGDLLGAGAQAGQRGVNVATGMNDSTRKRIADALMAGDTGMIEQALSRAQTTQQRKAIIDALVRIGGMQNTGQSVGGSGR